MGSNKRRPDRTCVASPPSFLPPPLAPSLSLTHPRKPSLSRKVAAPPPPRSPTNLTSPLLAAAMKEGARRGDLAAAVFLTQTVYTHFGASISRRDSSIQEKTGDEMWAAVETRLRETWGYLRCLALNLSVYIYCCIFPHVFIICEYVCVCVCCVFVSSLPTLRASESTR